MHAIVGFKDNAVLQHATTEAASHFNQGTQLASVAKRLSRHRCGVISSSWHGACTDVLLSSSLGTISCSSTFGHAALRPSFSRRLIRNFSRRKRSATGIGADSADGYSGWAQTSKRLSCSDRRPAGARVGDHSVVFERVAVDGVVSQRSTATIGTSLGTEAADRLAPTRPAEMWVHLGLRGV